MTCPCMDVAGCVGVRVLLVGGLVAAHTGTSVLMVIEQGLLQSALMLLHLLRMHQMQGTM